MPALLAETRRVCGWHTSPIAVPSSASRKTKAICASVNLDVLMLTLRSKPNPKLETQ